MKNIFRAIAYFFLAIVFFGSLSLFIFQDKAIAYLSSLAQANNQKVENLPNSPKNIANNEAINPDSIFKDPKFIKLKKAVVDNTGLNLPRPDNGSATTTPDDQLVEKLPDFKVGNNNPFKPF